MEQQNLSPASRKPIDQQAYSGELAQHVCPQEGRCESEPCSLLPSFAKWNVSTAEYHPPPWILCSTCHVITEQDLTQQITTPQTNELPKKTWDILGELHVSIADLCEAALSGCIVCNSAVRLLISHAYLIDAAKVSCAAASNFSLQHNIMELYGNRTEDKYNAYLDWKEGVTPNQAAAFSNLDKITHKFKYNPGHSIQDGKFKHCRVCRVLILAQHLHCSECVETYDLCVNCAEQGNTCLDPVHCLEAMCCLYEKDDHPKRCFNFTITRTLTDGNELHRDKYYSLALGISTGCSSVYDSLELVRTAHADELGHASRQTPNTGDAQTLSLATEWLQQCKVHHPFCAIGGDEWMPTRLIKIEESIARLVICRDEKVRHSYATLSHCWGIKKFFNLTSATSSMLKIGVSLEQLPVSFREAIATAAFLGLEYIWIDSLCIVQGTDDLARQDWDRESRLMDKVYANGDINIAISHAKSPDIGCFKDRRPDRHSYAVIAANKNTQTFQWKVAEEFIDHSVGDLPFHREPMMKRGWCVQEMVLCRRMLVFARDGIYWQCRSCSLLTEEWPAGDIILPSQESFSIRPGCLNQAKDTTQDLYRFWARIVTHYSKTELTHPVKDKLRAIEGIANCIRDIQQDAYLWGHFFRTLPFSLCWRGSHVNSHISRMLCSWAWPSVNWFVNPGNQGSLSNGRPLVALAQLVFPHRSSDFEESVILKTPLTLVGRLLLARILTIEDDRTFSPYNIGIGTSQWAVKADFDETDCWQSLWSKKSWFYILPIFRSYSRTPDNSMILLTRLKDGTFSRIGVAREYDSAAPRSSEQDWLLSYRKTKPSLIMLV